MDTVECPKCGVTSLRVINEDFAMYRKLFGLSLREMARELKVAPPYLCRIESRKEAVSLNMERALIMFVEDYIKYLPAQPPHPEAVQPPSQAAEKGES